MVGLHDGDLHRWRRNRHQRADAGDTAGGHRRHALGYEDVVDHDELRHDPVMAEPLGVSLGLL
jgi:hypothetical protein